MKTFLIFTDYHRAEVASSIKQNVLSELPNARVIIIDDMDLHANLMLDFIENFTFFKVNMEKRGALKEERKAEKNVDELPPFSNQFLEEEDSYKAMLNYFTKYTPDYVITIGYGAFQEAVAVRDRLGAKTKVVNFIDDYTLNKMLVSPYLDGYVVENMPLKKELIALGVAIDKVAISALPIENKYFDFNAIKGNRRIDLNPLMDTVLYLASSEKTDHRKNLNALKKYEGKVNLVVYCGQNRDSYRYCLKAGLNAFNEGISLPMLYDNAEVIFTTGNAYEISVARAMGKIIVALESEVIMESRNVDYLSSIVIDCRSSDALKRFFEDYSKEKYNTYSLRSKVVARPNILGALEKFDD